MKDIRTIGSFTAGLKIDRSVYYKGDCDISDLITKSAKEVENLRDERIGNENAAYEKVYTGSCGMGKVGACYQKDINGRLNI